MIGKCDQMRIVKKMFKGKPENRRKLRKARLR
jgi:hypothetical protein